MNNTPYLNRAKVKELALAISRNTGRPFTRVSGEFLEQVNARVAEHVAAKIHSAPSKGKTL